MRLLWIFSIIFLSLVPNHPAGAQEHHHAQAAPNAPGFEQYLKLWGLEKTTPLPFLEKAPKEQEPPVPEEKRFSWWGYRHAEVHDNGLVAILQKLTGSNCCHGPKSGECRVSSINMPARLVLVDGQWCPYSDKTKVVVLGELESLRDGQRAIALVCAGRTYEMTGWEGPKRRTCPDSYCIGILPVKM